MSGAPLIIDEFTSWSQDVFSASGRWVNPVVSLWNSARGVEFELCAPWWENPSPDEPIGSCEGLWDYEVIELFLVGDSGRYLEIEIGPYGHYLVLQLSAPRVVTARGLELSELECTRDTVGSETYALQSAHRLDHAKTPTVYRSQGVRWSAQGLIDHTLLPPPKLTYDHDTGEERSGWDLNLFWCFSRHLTRYYCCATPLPGERADFHQPQHFSLHLSSSQEERPNGSRTRQSPT